MILSWSVATALIALLPLVLVSYSDVPLEVRIKGDRISGIFHPKIPHLQVGYNL